MRSIGVLALAFSVGLSSFASAQATMPGQTVQAPPSTATPQRKPARPLRPGETPPKGTAVIKGQVLASTGSPVRRAQVRAMSMEARGGGVTSTDAEGRFEIRDLPAGRYTITATKGGYVTGQYGQRRPGEPGTPIDKNNDALTAQVGKAAMVGALEQPTNSSARAGNAMVLVTRTLFLWMTLLALMTIAGWAV